jgi:hypothetical protein
MRDAFHELSCSFFGAHTQRLYLSSIVNLDKNTPLLCKEGPGVVALMFLSPNKTVNPFPQRDARGTTTLSRQLVDPFGKIPYCPGHSIRKRYFSKIQPRLFT